YDYTRSFFFFFSSRRRHTRWPRDWSSDVCSSDLLLVLAALPWEAADLGLYLPGSIFMSAQHPGGSPLAAVHHGHHHGMDGTLLVLTVLLLSRTLRPGRLHGLLAAYLALLLGYGLGNVVNDGWLEQVAKRGW